MLHSSLTKTASSGIKARQVFPTSSFERMLKGNGVSIPKGSSLKVSHGFRSEFVAFQERFEQRLDDVISTLKSILLYVSRLEQIALYAWG